MKILITFLFLISSLLSVAQKLNQFGPDGKKEGLWIKWLDKNFKVVKDSSEARFYRYTPYVHGKDLYNLGAFGRKGWTLERPADQFSAPEMLNGIYYWKDTNGITRSIHVLKDGVYISIKEFDEHQNLQSHWNYQNKYQGDPNSYHYSSFKDGKETKYVFYNGEKGWMLYFVELLDDGL